ncbi:MAG: hypothetical protein AMXMBFR67_37260 [Nitrospira sp.]
MICVIPSCRRIEMANFEPLIEAGARFIIVDDSPGSIRISHPQFSVYNWEDRRRFLGANEVAIPRGNGACRNLGFYVAWRESSPEELVLALDDDCVVGPEFPKEVDAILSRAERPLVQGDGGHFNTFDLFDDARLSCRFPRGFPYSQRVGYQPWSTTTCASRPVAFNVGLWRGIPDVNAIDRLPEEDINFPTVRLRDASVIVPPGARVSVCSGSMHFRSRLVPAVFQFPMNVELMPGWTINRYGDIWGGFTLKTLMDRRGDAMSVGGPIVHHLRAGPADLNARKEHLAHLVNEEFLSLLNEVGESLTQDTYLEMMAQVREELSRRKEKTSPILRAYLCTLDEALGAWIRALS